MRLFGLNRRRSETLLLAIGQLVLIAYVFQVAAFDHWHVDVSDVAGVAGSSEHATHADHCHGAPSSCADAGSGFAQVFTNQSVRLPESRALLVLKFESETTQPEDAFLTSLPEPPRAIA